MTPAVVRAVLDARPELLLRVDERRPSLFETEEWGALMSPEGEDDVSVYRYLLWRVFDEALPLLVVLMLNPSTATHLKGDPTADGLMRRARRLGYGGILVANCFAFRARDPADMRKADDPVGPANDDVLGVVLDQDADLLCAWGANGMHRGREGEVRCAISSGRARPHALRLCAGGAPEHPLYIPSAIDPWPWDPISAAI